jgi:hypothetical protein
MTRVLGHWNSPKFIHFGRVRNDIWASKFEYSWNLLRNSTKIYWISPISVGSKNFSQSNPRTLVMTRHDASMRVFFTPVGVQYGHHLKHAFRHLCGGAASRPLGRRGEETIGTVWAPRSSTRHGRNQSLRGGCCRDTGVRGRYLTYCPPLDTLRVVTTMDKNIFGNPDCSHSYMIKNANINQYDVNLVLLIK